MSSVGILPAVIAVLIALFTCFLLVKLVGEPAVQGRYTTIDGLRGYLAFFVFLHHSCIWYFYIQTGNWEIPPSNLYSHFGSSSVALFFMITGFLFFNKLIDGRLKSIDWGRLFISRFLRLVPLYLFAMLLLFLIVAFISEGKLNEPYPDLVKGIIRWLSFTILGSPDLNGIQNTSYIIAWVTWSLPYEWLFYFSLPLLSLTVRAIPPLLYIILSIIIVVVLVSILHPEIQHLLSFLGGVISSFLVRIKFFRQFAVTKLSSFIALGCIIMVVTFYPTSQGIVPKVILSLFFALIASGNSLFGILVKPVSIILGEITYSIYLLHGMLLFFTFNIVLGTSLTKTFSPSAHWLLIFCMTPILIIFCFLTFRLVENPAMRNTTKIYSWLRFQLTLHLKIPDPNRSLNS